MIIDAENAIFGRLCSYVAKQALESNEIVIVNSEKSIMTGNKKDLINKYKILRAKGGFSQKGPKYSKTPYRMLKRGIRGMLPDHRRGQGKLAFLRVKCHDGVPEEFKDKEKVKFKEPGKNKYITLKELSEKL